MKIELKHIVSYLPYNLKIASVNLKGEISEVYTMEMDNNKNDYGISNVVFGVNQIPVLRPLSDITKQIEHNGEKFTPSLKFDLIVDKEGVCYDRFYAEQCEIPFVDVPVTQFNDWLFEYNFDVYNLIGRGLAIDINTLKI